MEKLFTVGKTVTWLKVLLDTYALKGISHILHLKENMKTRFLTEVLPIIAKILELT